MPNDNTTKPKARLIKKADMPAYTRPQKPAKKQKKSNTNVRVTDKASAKKRLGWD